MPNNQTTSLLPVDPNSIEYRFIVHYFNTTKGGGAQNITQVQKIKNTPV